MNQNTQMQDEIEKECPVELPFRYTLPDAVHRFFGRTEELKRIHECLEKDSITVVSQIETIPDIGGVGKTEVARAYAHSENGKKYNIIIYVLADSPVSLKDAYTKIAKEFKIEVNNRKIEDIVEELYQNNLSCYKTLIVFDNVDDPVDIVPYLPGKYLKDKKPKVLITSRRQDWDFGDCGHVEIIKLEGFSLETTALFAKKYLIAKVYTDEDIEDFWKLVHGLPLFVAMVVGLIKDQNPKIIRKKYTIKNFSEDIKNRVADLEKMNYPENRRILMAIVAISIEKIRSFCGSLGEIALKIIENVAYMPPDNVSILLIYHDQDRKLRAIVLMGEYGLLNYTFDDIFMHRSVSPVIRDYLKQNNREETVIQELVDLFNDCDECDSLYPYISYVWEMDVKFQAIIKERCKHKKILEKILKSKMGEI